MEYRGLPASSGGGHGVVVLRVGVGGEWAERQARRETNPVPLPWGDSVLTLQIQVSPFLPSSPAPLNMMTFTQPDHMQRLCDCH